MLHILVAIMFTGLLIIGCSGAGKKDWEWALKIDERTTYKLFISNYPGSHYADKAKKRLIELEEKEWEKALKIDISDMYRAFIYNYPKSNHIEEAKERLAKLEKKDWEMAQSENNVSSYKKFIQVYPKSNHIEEAKGRLAKLEKKDWKIAQSKNTVSSYNHFIRTYPTSEYEEKAKEKLAHLEWKIAQSKNTVSSYNHFIKNYTYSKFSSKARERLQELVNNIELEFNRKLEEIKSSSQINELIEEYSEYKFVDKIIPNLESIIVKKIKNEGVSDRYVDQVWKPTGGTPGSVTIGTVREGFMEFIIEFPGDTIQISESGFALPPLAYDSIHRFKGKVTLGSKTFIGEGDKLNRLTFAIVEDVGYVYIRGTGTVILPTGEKIKFGAK